MIEKAEKEAGCQCRQAGKQADTGRQAGRRAGGKEERKQEGRQEKVVSWVRWQDVGQIASRQELGEGGEQRSVGGRNVLGRVQKEER